MKNLYEQYQDEMDIMNEQGLPKNLGIIIPEHEISEKFRRFTKRIAPDAYALIEAIPPPKVENDFYDSKKAAQKVKNCI